MRKVDKLGRIVIPSEMREKYGLCEGASIEFFDTGDGITIKCDERICKICRGRVSESSELPLCDECKRAAAESYANR